MDFDFINIIGTLFDNSIKHVVALAHQIKDLRLGKNQQEINEDIYDKIDNISEKSKGYFSSFDSLNQLFPNPKIGDWAIVKNSSNGNWYIYKCTTEGEWSETDEEYTQEIDLNEYTKSSDFKTINGESIVGTGDIEIKGASYNIASSENDGLLSKELYSQLITLKNTTIPEMQSNIDSILLLFDNTQTPDYIQDVIDKYNRIQEFIESLNGSEDQEVLAQLIENINDLQQQINTEKNRAEEIELYLSNRLNSLEEAIATKDSTKHVFLTQVQYDALVTYEKDTLYLIVENTNGSRFGDAFPLVFGSSSVFGDPFPIILS